MSSGGAASAQPGGPLGEIAQPAGFGAKMTLLARSGLVVPAHAVMNSDPDDVTVNRDGRRRVEIGKNDRKQIRRAIDVLKSFGFAVLLRCDDARPTQKDGAPPCGQLLVPERGERPGDNGFGCRCSRIHLGR